MSDYWRVCYRVGDGVSTPRRRVFLFSSTSERDARRAAADLNVETGTTIFYVELEGGDYRPDDDVTVDD